MIWNAHMKKQLTQLPWLDILVYKNKLSAYIRPTGNMALLAHVAQNIQGRKQVVAKDKSLEDDFLSKYIQVQAEDATLPQW